MHKNYMLSSHRLANLLLRYPNTKQVWEKVIERSISINGLENCNSDNGFFKVKNGPVSISENIVAIENILGIEQSYEIFNNITQEILETAAEMYIYLNHCPNGGNPVWVNFYKDLFQQYEPKQILITLNRLRKTSQFKIANELINHLESIWNLKFNNIPSDFRENELQLANILRSSIIYVQTVPNFLFFHVKPPSSSCHW